MTSCMKRSAAAGEGRRPAMRRARAGRRTRRRGALRTAALRTEDALRVRAGLPAAAGDGEADVAIRATPSAATQWSCPIRMARPHFARGRPAETGEITPARPQVASQPAIAAVTIDPGDRATALTSVDDHAVPEDEDRGDVLIARLGHGSLDHELERVRADDALQARRHVPARPTRLGGREASGVGGVAADARLADDVEPPRGGDRAAVPGRDAPPRRDLRVELVAGVEVVRRGPHDVADRQIGLDRRAAPGGRAAGRDVPGAGADLEPLRQATVVVRLAVVARRRLDRGEQAD